MRWTIHIPFRPLPWRGLLPVATCMLLHTAPLLRLIPARVFAPAGVVRCVLRIYACDSIQWGTKRVTFTFLQMNLRLRLVRSGSALPVDPPARERNRLNVPRSRPATRVSHKRSNYGANTWLPRAPELPPGCEHADRVFPCDVLQVRVTRSVCIGV